MEQNNSIFVVITAGGQGTRMGGPVAKQFLEIAGEPIIYKTIKIFLSFKCEILLVLPSEYKEYWKRYCLKNSLRFKHRLVSGGITRFHSVQNALKYVPDGAKVIIHDGVRPFVPRQMITELLNFNLGPDSELYGVVPVVSPVDSMREKLDDGTTVVVQRSRYLMVQTPQLFLSTQLKEAYQKAYSPSFTDDASVLEAAGYNVGVIEGSRLNIKITTPGDLATGEAINSFMQKG